MLLRLVECFLKLNEPSRIVRIHDVLSKRLLSKAESAAVLRLSQQLEQADTEAGRAWTAVWGLGDERCL